VRPRALTWLLALAGAAIVLYLGSTPSEDVYWSDFSTEAWPAFQRLLEGDLSAFLAASPVGYGGSMVLRAPFGALAGALGFESAPAVFRIGAVPCVLALAVLAAFLAERARAAASGRWWLVVLGLGAASPLAWQGVWFGHPEELLATALAVGAVLSALGGRALLAGALLGLAVASKQWAVLAVLPTLLAAPEHRIRLLAAAAGAGGAVMLPIMLADAGAFAAAQEGVTSSAQWFRPRQLWWPLGAAPPPGIEHPVGAAVTPAWLAPYPKPLIVALSLPLAALWVRRGGPRSDALLLLALLMLVRCLLDPWNVIYYHLPLVIALLAWEVVSGRRVPVVSLLATAGVWLSFQTYDVSYGYGPWLVYLAWTLPLAAYLARELYRPGPLLARRRRAVPATA
jgi:Glycosyltransferase family 87